MAEDNGFDGSSRPVYLFAFLVGAGIAIYLYFVKFDELSETQLVNYSGVWFLMFVFGGTGLALEAAATLVAKGEVENLSKGIVRHGCGTAPITWLFFFPLLFYNAAKNAKKTLPVAIYITAVWAALFYFFMAVVFPAL